MAANDMSIQQPLCPPPVQRIHIEDLPAHLETLETELEAGGRIELLRGATVVADLRVPEEVASSPVLPASERPDFMARLKQMWGDRVFEDSTEWIRKDRDAGS